MLPIPVRAAGWEIRLMVTNIKRIQWPGAELIHLSLMEAEDCDSNG